MSLNTTWDEINSKVSNKDIAYCIHKNWGLGLIVSIDENYYYIDFPGVNKSEHKTDINYAKEILYPISEKSFIASTFRGPKEQLIYKYENHPSEIVRALLDEADEGELKYQDLKFKLRIVYHGLGFGKFLDLENFEKWWISLFKILKDADWLYSPLNTVDGFILIVPGTKDQMVQTNSQGFSTTFKVKECIEVIVEPVRYISTIDFNNKYQSSRRLKIYFESNFIIPILKNTTKGIDVTDALPTELNRSDIIFLQKEFSDSAIIAVSNMALGEKAIELRRCAGLWREPISKLTENPISLVQRLNKIGHNVHENTASNWIRGTLRIAPQPHNLAALGKLCKNAGYQFDIRLCTSAALTVELAHRNAGRCLSKYLRTEINKNKFDDTLDLTSGITLDIGDQKLVINFYRVISISNKIFKINSNMVNRIYI